jgi:hypothetical protein
MRLKVATFKKIFPCYFFSIAHFEEVIAQLRRNDITGKDILATLPF